jgi:hypothetical protein
MKSPRQTLCPSAPPQWEGSQVIGVVGGTADVPYLPEPLPVTDELLALAGPVAPQEVFRFAAPCACSGCGHFAKEESKCRLAEKVARWVPIAVEKLPPCSIRPNCRWWQREGKAACLRCPQVVTHNFKPSQTMREAGDPAVALSPRRLVK